MFKYDNRPIHDIQPACRQRGILYAISHELVEAQFSTIGEFRSLTPELFEDLLVELRCGPKRAAAYLDIWEFINTTEFSVAAVDLPSAPRSAPVVIPTAAKPPAARAFMSAASVVDALKGVRSCDNLGAAFQDQPWSAAPTPAQAIQALPSLSKPIQTLRGIVQRNIIGSAEFSFDTYISMVRMYMKFVGCIRGVTRNQGLALFPVRDDVVLLWTGIFRNEQTCANYVAALKWACRCLGMPTSFDNDVLRAAIRGIGKQGLQVRSLKAAIRLPDLQSFVRYARNVGLHSLADGMIIGYNFLLRIGSELCGVPASAISVSNGVTILRLARRKNKFHGSVLQRACLCSADPSMCPHLAAERSLASGRRFLVEENYPQFLKSLRAVAKAVGFPEAERLGTQAFRRGAARDIVANGGSVDTLLLAGEWCSSAWSEYVGEAGAVTSAECLLNVLVAVDEMEEEDH